jgi:hypothetical protein
LQAGKDSNNPDDQGRADLAPKALYISYSGNSHDVGVQNSFKSATRKVLPNGAFVSDKAILTSIQVRPEYGKLHVGKRLSCNMLVVGS